MKRLTALLLVLTLLLCGCGCKKANPPATEPTQETELTQVTVAPTVAPTAAPTAAPTVAPTVAPTAAPTVAPTVAPTAAPTAAPTKAPTVPPTTAPTQGPSLPPQVADRNPLTGAMLDGTWSGQIAAVMVNNIRDAMPQYGLSQADVIYEIEEESGITRNMALYSDVSKVNKIGSIRSTRTAFVSVAAAYDAYLVHCGTSSHAEGGRYDSKGNKIVEWKDIDQFYKSAYFYRDQDRINSGYAWEHTLFTTGSLLQKAMNNKDLSETKTGFLFQEKVVLPGDTSAKEVTVKFKGGKTTSFTYDEASGLYTRSQYGGVTVDGSTNETVKVKNIIALYTNQWRCSCWSDGHQFYDTIGSGEGYAAVNGKIVPIKWSRASVDAPFIYTLEDGSYLQLDVGSSYIALIGIKHPISYK